MTLPGDQPPIRILTDPAEAQSTILRRRPLGEVEVSPQLADGIRHIFGEDLTPGQVVERIIADVRQRGDAALFEYTARIDGVELDDLRVSQEEIEAAWQATPEALRQALEVAVERIRRFHQHERHASWMDWHDGEAVGQIVRPLERVGVYVPGGTAPLPSSLLMAALPAQVAGVEDIIACTPPQKDGTAAPVVLAAAKVAGVSRVFKLGGAQAIAALAFGTASVPRVDKVVGPGNLFVVLAKKAVFGAVGIESLPGPTETVLIADDSADPAWVAADLLAQAEHLMASAILLTPSPDLAAAVQAEVAHQLPNLRWRDGIARALDRSGGIVVVRDLDQAIDLANQYAPEHLCLLVREPWSLVGRVRNAGGVFVGESSSEALGDYVMGPSHVMPTSGTARFASPLHVRDFLKVISVFAIDREKHNQIAPAAIEIAEAETLTAHANALRVRLDPDSVKPN
jgi:histidinol dehydrogenase